MKKITKATLKSFIRKNSENLFINNKSVFDGMTDGIEKLEGRFIKADKSDEFEQYTLGVKGVWIVNGSKNYFSEYDDGTFQGIEVLNCCGKFIVAIKK